MIIEMKGRHYWVLRHYLDDSQDINKLILKNFILKFILIFCDALFFKITF